MAKDSNIVHQYFKKEMGDATVMVKVNPLRLKVTEITIHKDHEPEMREIQVDPDIFEDLKADGFVDASPLEFNLYLSGLA